MISHPIDTEAQLSKHALASCYLCKAFRGNLSPIGKPAGQARKCRLVPDGKIDLSCRFADV